MIAFREVSSRVAAYRSDAFQREVGEILERPRRDIRLYVDSLVKADRLPVDPPGEAAAAVATEAARILSAVFSRQIKAASVVRVTDRILTMTHQCDVVERNSAAHAVRRLGTFEDDLAQALRGVWETSEGIVAGLPFPPHVVVTWNDGGSVLYGHIKDTREGTTALYSNATIPAAPDGAWTFVHTDAVGGSEFAPMPLLGFAECVRDAVRADEDDDEGDSA
jgi:hypothetical protein